MDTKTETQIVGSDPLGYLTQHKVMVGARQLKKARISGKARLVCLAENADPALTGPIQVLCQQNSVACAWVPSMADLGRACGIDVGAAAAAAVD